MSEEKHRPARLPGGRWDVPTLAILTIACLAPFAGKAFHIDDPLFIWSARHLVRHPADPYGLSVNWGGTAESMHRIMWNPPASSYYMALVGSLFGWGEVPLHLAYLIVAVLAVLGTYSLARRFSDRPLIAGLVALFTPAFLVCSSTVMCDTLMLAFLVWAAALWVRGIDDRNGWILLGAALAMSMSLLTKYNALLMFPSLVSYAWMRRHGPGLWSLYFLIPLAALAGYLSFSLAAYGQAVAGGATAHEGAAGGMFGTTLVGLSFVGGGLAPLIFTAPLVWARRGLTIGVGVAIVAAVGSRWLLLYDPVSASDPLAAAWVLPAHLGVFVAAGVGLVAVAASDLIRKRDAAAWMLALWLGAGLVFATFVSWANSGRYVLPLVPAAAILVARALDSRSQRRPVAARSLTAALAIAAVVGIAVEWSDFALANSARRAAQEISGRFSSGPGKLIFQGHWGFQYYMMAQHAEPLELAGGVLSVGDHVVTPLNGPGISVVPPNIATVAASITFPAGRWVTTMSRDLRIGFHASTFGAVPFAFAKIPDERYIVHRVTEATTCSRAN